MTDPAPTADKKETPAKNVRPAKAELDLRQLKIKLVQAVDKKEPAKSKLDLPKPKLAPAQAVNEKVERTQVISQKPVARVVKPTPSPVKAVALPVSDSVTTSNLTKAENNASSEDVQEKVLSPEPARFTAMPAECLTDRTDDPVTPVIAEVNADFGQAEFFSDEGEIEPESTVTDLLELAELELNIDREAEMGLVSADTADEAVPTLFIAWDELIDEGHEPAVVLMQDLAARVEVISPNIQEAAKQKFEDILVMTQEIIESGDQALAEAKESLEEAVIEFFELIDIEYSQEQLKDFVAVMLEPGHSDFIKHFVRSITTPPREQGTREIIPNSAFPNLSFSSMARLATRLQLGKLTLARAVSVS